MRLGTALGAGLYVWVVLAAFLRMSPWARRSL